jgi:hypothetical protein
MQLFCISIFCMIWLCFPFLIQIPIIADILSVVLLCFCFFFGLTACLNFTFLFYHCHVHFPLPFCLEFCMWSNALSISYWICFLIKPIWNEEVGRGSFQLRNNLAVWCWIIVPVIMNSWISSSVPLVLPLNQICMTWGSQISIEAIVNLAVTLACGSLWHFSCSLMRIVICYIMMRMKLSKGLSKVLLHYGFNLKHCLLQDGVKCLWEWASVKILKLWRYCQNSDTWVAFAYQVRYNHFRFIKAGE